MSPSNSTEAPDSSQGVFSHPNLSLTIQCSDRWQVYHRLQSLGISCHCAGYQPLTVTVNSPIEAVQVRNVTQRINASRHELVTTLKRAWQPPYSPKT